jgi:hypothetical protein
VSKIKEPVDESIWNKGTVRETALMELHLKWASVVEAVQKWLKAQQNHFILMESGILGSSGGNGLKSKAVAYKIR